ncbi:redox-sensing transcriptional repressor Rex [Clostridium sediminicola]|uniref:redox-sensing transcriptional repressor Rex n=1 Tax=Clostridium sediminicola TaxID=3114879 RepID=UPI0031F21772
MEKKKKISMTVIRRLPKYHRYLEMLLKNSVDRISSKELSLKIGFTASQIRQDLNCFGDFGQQGYGYNVADLYKEVSSILGINIGYRTIIVGAGNIGQATANYSRFKKKGFKIEAIFDVNPKLIGLKISDVEVLDIDKLEEFLKENKIDIGVICVPYQMAQNVCDMLVQNGVKGIWNFAPIDLKANYESIIENVHLSESLLTLTYLMQQNKKYS